MHIGYGISQEKQLKGYHFFYLLPNENKEIKAISFPSFEVGSNYSLIYFFREIIYLSIYIIKWVKRLRYFNNFVIIQNIQIKLREILIFLSLILLENS